MNRIKSLDALRGLAATVVVFSHIHGVFFVHHIWLDLTPMRLLWAGGESVILFFVLSGYVLSAPYCRSQDGVPYGRFLLTRLSRIYLPYLAAIASALLLSWLVYDPAAAATQPFLAKLWPQRVDWSLLASHAIVLGNFNTDAYDVVIWSLVHEMRFALIFPAFIWMVRTLSWRQALLACGVLSLAAAGASSAGLDPVIGFKNSYLYSAHYLLFFLVGALLCRHAPALAPLLAALSRRQTGYLLVAGLTLYVYSDVLYSLPKKMRWQSLTDYGSFIEDWGVGLAAAVLIALAVHHPGVSAFLNRRLFVFLGKISYSLYLVHILVLAAMLHLLNGQPTWLCVALALPLIFIAAILFHRWVEQPAHALGRRLAAGRAALARQQP
ncbi:acyltransferase family protein [Paludibacterium yongneupense]|uniref:acyltransferase family protein n=1 Tax=Paludibacterium yongneupense TaxID=400061 RepID=UPI0004128695|nr:acyltransferase [Paludibacterium yongneupense]